MEQLPRIAAAVCALLQARAHYAARRTGGQAASAQPCPRHPRRKRQGDRGLDSILRSRRGSGVLVIAHSCAGRVRATGPASPLAPWPCTHLLRREVPLCPPRRRSGVPPEPKPGPPSRTPAHQHMPARPGSTTAHPVPEQPAPRLTRYGRTPKAPSRRGNRCRTADLACWS